jgi:hypothetical protein
MNVLKRYAIKVSWFFVSRIPIFPKGLRPWDKVSVTTELLAKIYNKISSLELDLFFQEEKAARQRMKNIKKDSICLKHHSKDCYHKQQYGNTSHNSIIKFG